MLRDSLSTLLRELVHGTAPNEGYILNVGDVGLIRSLDGLGAEAASAPAPAGGASIAAHVDHLRYGFELLNRWSEGEMPFAEADYGTAWNNGTVSPEEWKARRTALATQIAKWERVVAEPREMSQLEENGVVASIAHLAYHLGAIRQINKSLQGPRAHSG
jgi:hypothetical protein